MSYFNQPPYGVPPYGLPMQPGFPPGYAQPYPAFPQQPVMPLAAPAAQPFAQPFQSPYAAQAPFVQPQPAQYYQQQPYAQQPGYPAAQPYVQQPYAAQQPYVAQQPYAAQQMQPPMQQTAFNQQIIPAAQMDVYGLPQVPGDITLQYPQTFRLEEKVMSATRDSFVVRDQQGALRYKVDGSFTIHERKTIKNLHGQVLLKLREARLKMRDRITLFNASNVAIMTLQKASAIQIGSKRVNGYLGASITGQPAIIITGNHNNTHFRITNAQNQEIAVIRRRKFSMKNMLTDQDTYDVTVNQGSPALICFITVALDEIYED